MEKTCYLFFADREVDRLAVWQERERSLKRKKDGKIERTIFGVGMQWGRTFGKRHE